MKKTTLFVFVRLYFCDGYNSKRIKIYSEDQKKELFECMDWETFGTNHRTVEFFIEKYSVFGIGTTEEAKEELAGFIKENSKDRWTICDYTEAKTPEKFSFEFEARETVESWTIQEGDGHLVVRKSGRVLCSCVGSYHEMYEKWKPSNEQDFFIF